MPLHTLTFTFSLQLLIEFNRLFLPVNDNQSRLKEKRTFLSKSAVVVAANAAGGEKPTDCCNKVKLSFK